MISDIFDENIRLHDWALNILNNLFSLSKKIKKINGFLMKKKLIPNNKQTKIQKIKWMDKKWNKIKYNTTSSYLMYVDSILHTILGNYFPFLNF